MSEMYVEQDIVRLKAEFPDVFSDILGKAGVSPMSVELEPGTRPHQAHPYRFPDCLKQDVKDELFKIISEGYVEPCKSLWASPIVPVPKPDGSVHLCIDFRRLNSSTVAHPYYMAILDEILERVGQSQIVS